MEVVSNNGMQGRYSQNCKDPRPEEGFRTSSVWCADLIAFCTS